MPNGRASYDAVRTTARRLEPARTSGLPLSGGSAPPAPKPVRERLPFPIARETAADLFLRRSLSVKELALCVCVGGAIDRQVVVMTEQIHEKMCGRLAHAFQGNQRMDQLLFSHFLRGGVNSIEVDRA